VGEGLVIPARALGGIIEAAGHTFLPKDLVKWYLERVVLKNNAMLQRFKAFVDKCRNLA
jgi:gamma-glutamyl-gamma-aminobutyrate hydrolase PuuD